MEKFSTEQIFELYRFMGLDDPKFFDDANVVNLFRILNIEPKFNEDGSLKKTPYELLGVLPIFEDNQEKPIVFAIKNRTEKIGKYEGEELNFIYKKSKIKEEKSVLRTLKERYRSAIFSGDEAQAESCIRMIEELTGGLSSEFLDSFYDYTKFYKKMKKQLLLDLFAHFFLQYIQARSALIKNGIILKDKVYRPYRQEPAYESYAPEIVLDEATVDMPKPMQSIDPVAFGLQNVKKVVINDQEMSEIAEFKIEKKEIKVKTKANFATAIKQESDQVLQTVDAAQQEVPSQAILPEVEIQQQDDFDFNSAFGAFIQPFIKKKNRTFRRMQTAFQMGDTEDFEEKEAIPFSKVEKSQSKDSEMEIEI